MALPDRAAHGRGGAYGLAAAALSGASAPVSKLFLPHAGPLVLAALLYLGAGVGLSLARLLAARDPTPREAALRRTDVALLAGVVLFGGLVGPALMLVGLAPASPASPGRCWSTWKRRSPWRSRSFCSACSASTSGGERQPPRPS